MRRVRGMVRYEGAVDNEVTTPVEANARAFIKITLIIPLYQKTPFRYRKKRDSQPSTPTILPFLAYSGIKSSAQLRPCGGAIRSVEEPHSPSAPLSTFPPISEVSPLPPPNPPARLHPAHTPSTPIPNRAQRSSERPPSYTKSSTKTKNRAGAAPSGKISAHPPRCKDFSGSGGRRKLWQSFE